MDALSPSAAATSTLITIEYLSWINARLRDEIEKRHELERQQELLASSRLAQIRTCLVSIGLSIWLPFLKAASG